VSTPPGLGPHCVGQRVVIRRVLPGQTGPSGGPAMTDLLGVMESWVDTTTTVRDESGSVTEIRIADIVSGKPVPPRPSVRLRVSAEEAERRANAGWPAVETERLGDWLLRASAGFSSRANSVLAVGDPGTDLAQALSRTVDFYRSRSLPPWAQLVVGSEEHRAFEAAGWLPARPGEADTSFQLGAVSRALRTVRGLLPSGAPEVVVGTSATAAWLADDQRALRHHQAALAVLEGADQAGFAGMRAPGPDPAGDRMAAPLVAKGRAAMGADEDWVGITDVWVSPDHRRQGLALVVLAALLGWAAERGAATAYLQVRGDNPAALALYDRLGFLPHHDYRYLTAPTP
jgi:GNAT superfamily N-acetyltransferase